MTQKNIDHFQNVSVVTPPDKSLVLEAMESSDFHNHKEILNSMESLDRDEYLYDSD